MLKLNRSIMGGTTFSLLILAPLGSLAHGNERGEGNVTVAGAKVVVNYGRPMLKGRDLTKMIQPGQLWRIGADAPTTLESETDLDFGGTRVPKGKHILLARLVQPGQWSLVFSTKSASQYEPGAKIAEVPLELEQGRDSVELVSIGLRENGDHGVIEIAWGTMRLRASFTPAK